MLKSNLHRGLGSPQFGKKGLAQSAFNVMVLLVRELTMIRPRALGQTIIQGLQS